MPLVMPLHSPTVSNVAAERHRLPVAAPLEPWESAGTRLVPVGFAFPDTGPSVATPLPGESARCPASPNRRSPTIAAFHGAASWRGRQPTATTRRRVMLAWRRSVVPAGRCTPTGSRRRAGPRPVRWNCQGWRCGFAFCGRVALGHIMADYEKIQLAANLPNLVIF